MRNFLYAIVLVALTGLVQAQMVPPVNTNPTTVINGSVNPSLIPDALAMRLFASLTAANPTDSPATAATKVATANSVGLSTSDTAAMAVVLAAFQQNFQTFVNNYNQGATSQTQGNYNIFIAQRDNLATQLKANIETALSPTGAVQFDAFIQSEKTRITLSIQ